MAHQVFRSASSTEGLNRSARVALDSRSARDGGDVCVRILDRPDLAAALDELRPTSTTPRP
jgi:hypothetical protein